MTNANMSKVTVNPKVVFGVDGNMRNSLHLYDETKLIYVAGMNVVQLDLETGNQSFIAATESCRQINYISLSPQGRFLAICERADPLAQIQIVETANERQKAVFPDADMENLAIECKEFLACAFSSNTEGQHLVTLCGDGDWCAILWQWEQKKMLAKVDISVINPAELDLNLFQISLAHIITDPVCVVTGPNTFKYYKIKDHHRNFREVHSQLRPHGRDEVSSIYTCHTWAKDKVQLVVATASGDIMVCAMSGEFHSYVQQSPFGHRIDSVCAYSQGLLFGGQDGTIWNFQGT